MLFNSLNYLIFFPVVCIFYFVLPSRYRWLWLLLCSYFFYMCWEARYATLMLLSTFLTYLSGLFLEKINNRGDLKHAAGLRKWVVFFSFASNLGILFFFKYFNFTTELMTSAFARLSISWEAPFLNVLLPVGISFYTFQALSYTMDVYRGHIPAQRHFGKYALFVSFFPQLVAGPIEQSEHLLPQLERVNKFDWDRMRTGLITMGIGYFKKVVIADRVAIIVNTVYNDITSYSGLYLVIATLFFAIQIYCDFGGYSDIAIGSAKVLGYDLTVNFKRPYFSKSISEFWRRWHITLGNWFRDYLYIPLGGNRVPKWRNLFNIMIVFFASGLWHGANLTFVVWGGLHGIYQVIGKLLSPIRKRIVAFSKTDTTSFSFRFWQVLITFSLTCFAWIFFRANSMQDAVYVIQNMFEFNYWVLSDGSLYTLGLPGPEFNFAVVSVVMLFALDWFTRRQDVPAFLSKQNLAFRWMIYIGAVLFIIVFGSYGIGYSAADFIYFQF